MQLTSGSPSHPAVSANSLMIDYNHDDDENRDDSDNGIDEMIMMMMRIGMTMALLMMMMMLNLGKVRDESGGRPARSSSCISTY